MTAVHFGLRAERQANTVDVWWRENRPKAPNLFMEELAGAITLLEAAPEVGIRYLPARSGRVRRLLLPRTRYHLYYTYDLPTDTVVIVSVWSSVRGRGPCLR